MLTVILTALFGFLLIASGALLSAPDVKNRVSTLRGLRNWHLVFVMIVSGMIVSAANLIEKHQSKEKSESIEETLKIDQISPHLSAGLLEAVVMPPPVAVLLADKIDQRSSSYAKALKGIANGEFELALRMLDVSENENSEENYKIYRMRGIARAYMGHAIESLRWHRLAWESSPDNLALLADLGIALANAGQYDAADRKLSALLELRKDAIGQDSLKVADLSENIGWIRYLQGNYTNSREMLESSLRTRRKRQSLNRSSLARNMDRLARVLQATGDYKEAELVFEEALEVRKEIAEHQEVEVALSLSNLGSLYMEKGDYREAVESNENALGIFVQALGDEHPLVAASLNQLACAQTALGEDNDSALRNFNRALELRRQLMGEEHPAVAETLDDTGELLIHIGEYDEAERLISQALEIRRDGLGPTHPAVAESLNNLGSLYMYSRSDTTQSAKFFEDALDIWRGSLDEGHPYISYGVNNLGIVLHRNGEHGKASELLIESLKRREEKFGPESAAVARAKSNLGSCMYYCGYYDRAKIYLKEAYDYQKENVPHHLDYAQTLRHLAALLLIEGNSEKARRLVDNALSIARDSVGLNDQHWLTADLRSLRAYCLLEMGELEEVEAELSQSYAILSKAFGHRDQKTIDSVKRLIKYYEISGDVVRASELRALLSGETK